MKSTSKRKYQHIIQTVGILIFNVGPPIPFIFIFNDESVFFHQHPPEKCKLFRGPLFMLLKIPTLLFKVAVMLYTLCTIIVP